MRARRYLAYLLSTSIFGSHNTCHIRHFKNIKYKFLNLQHVCIARPKLLSMHKHDDPRYLRLRFWYRGIHSHDRSLCHLLFCQSFGYSPSILCFLTIDCFSDTQSVIVNTHFFRENLVVMDKLRKALSGQDSRDNDSSTGILPVSYWYLYSAHSLKFWDPVYIVDYTFAWTVLFSL